jgi:hypothetical protein
VPKEEIMTQRKSIESYNSTKSNEELAALLYKPTPEEKERRNWRKKILKKLHRASVDKFCLAILEENRENFPYVEELLNDIVDAKGIQFSLKIFQELKKPILLPKIDATIAKLRREAKRHTGLAYLNNNEIKKRQKEKQEIFHGRVILLSKVKSAIIQHLKYKLYAGKDKVMIRELKKITDF